MRIEVKRALWIPLSHATKLLAYSNERKVVRLAETTSQRILSCEKKSRGDGVQKSHGKLRHNLP